MNNENPNTYIITYSNHFKFEGRLLAFRKQLLFDITDTPNLIDFNNNGFWIINRKQLTKLKAKELIKMEPINVDVSDMQWYKQEQLNHVFNL